MKIIFAILLFFGPLVHSQFNITEIGPMPNDVSETSGLLWVDDRLYTINDSGGEAALYRIDTGTLVINTTITVENATNVDWEALAQDETYIYVGDFGNNLGLRTNLTVYRIPKTDLDNSASVTAEAIFFSYEDQTDFVDDGNSDWDAEAFIVLDDAIVVFTKQWQSNGTVAYRFPKIPGEHVAERMGALDAVGLVTDASYNETSNTLVLLGYSPFLSPFVLQFNSFSSNAIFAEAPTRFDLGIVPLQAEGIASNGNGGFFVSSEFFSRTTPNITSASRLFLLQLDGLPDPAPEPNPEPQPEPEPEPEPQPEPELVPEIPPIPDISGNEEEIIIIYTDTDLATEHYIINSERPIIGKRVYDVTGKKIWEQQGPDFERTGQWTALPRGGVYYLAVYFLDGVQTKAFITF